MWPILDCPWKVFGLWFRVTFPRQWSSVCHGFVLVGFGAWRLFEDGGRLLLHGVVRPVITMTSIKYVEQKMMTQDVC